jgi:succinoglycan biosynthesis transport protein ExoP
VVINRDRNELVTDPGVQRDDAPLRAEEVDTEIKVIESQELAGRVIDGLHLDRDAAYVSSVTNGSFIGRLRIALGMAPTPPVLGSADLRRRLSDNLIANLDASRLDTAYAIRIAYTDPDPARAAAIANAFAEGYTISAATAKRAENERALAVLRGKIISLQSAAEADFRAVQDFRVRNGLLSAQATSLAEQETAAYAQQLALARSSAAVDSGRAGAAAGKGEAAAVNSPVVQSLRAQRAVISVRVADLAGRYLDTHPDLVTARQQLADIDGQIAAETARARAGTGAGLRSDAAATANQVGALRASLSSAEGKLAANNKALVGLTDLTRKADASQALYESYLARYKEVLAQTGIEKPEARMLTHAQPPARPVSPNLVLNMALGLIVGLLVGAALAIATETSFSGMTTGEEVEQRLGVRYLGGIPLLGSVGLRGTNPADSLANHPGSAYAEAVRGLLGATRQGNRDRNQVIAISSALPDEGKTSLALSLARAAAMAGESVILIDCDSVQHGLSNLAAAAYVPTDEHDTFATRPGLREMMREGVKLGDAMIKDSASEAMILPITSAFADGERLLERGNFHRMIGALREHFGVIILDTAPILPIADTREVVSLADNVVVTALWRKTSDAALRAALRLLPLHGIDDIGVTLNRMDMRKQASFGGGDAAFYYEAYKKYYAA